MKVAQTLRSRIVTSRALQRGKEGFLLRHHLRIQGLLVVGLAPHFCLHIRGHHDFIEGYKYDCKMLLAIFVLNRYLQVQNRFHALYRSEVSAHGRYRVFGILLT